MPAATTAQVREAFDRTDIMALSTVDADGGSWTSPVQYQHDDQLNLYFSSLPGVRHADNIMRDDRVPVAIYSVPGPPGGNLGLQLRGRAELLGDPGSDGSGWQRFKITPDE